MLTRSQNSKKELNESLSKVLKSKRHFRKKEVIISCLQEKGANINHLNCLGNTPLHLASSPDEVLLLLILGADKNIRNYSGETPLLHIIKNDRFVSVGEKKCRFKKTKAIIRQFLRDSYRNLNLKMKLKDLKDNSPLFEYVFKNECDISIVKQFVHLGADLYIKSSRHNTLLHAAVTNPYCKSDVVKYLLEQGLHPNAENNEGQTPLHLCLRIKNFKLNIVEELIKHGGDVMKKSYRGNTPLYYAVLNRHCNLALMDLLLNGIDPSVLNVVLPRGSTLLHIVVTNMNLSVLEKFIACGVNINVTDNCLNTPLHLAVSMNYDETVSILLKHGADVNAKNNESSTPLHKALVVTNMNLSMFEKLISYGTDVNAIDNNSNTPLHLAASIPYCDETVISILLKQGADVNAKNKENNTPLHKAFQNTANIAVIKTLLHYKAKMCVLDYNAYTPLHYLIENSNFKLSFLIELLSTQKSIEACLKVTAKNRNFLSKCLLSGRIDLLKTVLKYLILKYHSRIEMREFPLVVELFYSNLDRVNWKVFNNFYRACMKEIDQMLKDWISNYINFYNVMVNEFSELTSRSHEVCKKQLIDAILFRRTDVQYPIYNDMLLYVRKQDFLENLDDVRVSTKICRDRSFKKIFLDEFSVRCITNYLSKEDVINLILAYSNVADSLEDEVDLNEKNVSNASVACLDFAKEVKIKVSRLSQEEMKKLCKPCKVVIKNDAETKLHVVKLENEQLDSPLLGNFVSNFISCATTCMDRKSLCKPCSVVIKNEVETKHTEAEDKINDNSGLPMDH